MVLVALLRNGSGPTVLVRSDLDALPVREQTGLSYASTATAKDASGNEEQAYRLANQLWPENSESLGDLAETLTRSGRAEEARKLLDDFTRAYPEQRSAIETFRGSIIMSVK